MAKYAAGKSATSYLIYVAIRILEMRRILKETGTLYLHRDPATSHYLKMVLDAVFGVSNYHNEIVWCHTGQSNAKNDFPRKHDTIFRYTKTDVFYFSTAEIKIPCSAGFLDRRKHPECKSGIFCPGQSENEKKKQEGSSCVAGKSPEDWWNDVPSGGQISRKE